MAHFHPFNISDDLIVVRKRDVLANSLAFTLATAILSKLTGHDSQHWMHELIEEARKSCNNYSKEEVDDFINGAQQIRDEQCK